MLVNFEAPLILLRSMTRISDVGLSPMVYHIHSAVDMAAMSVSMLSARSCWDSKSVQAWVWLGSECACPGGGLLRKLLVVLVRDMGLMRDMGE